MTDLFSRRVGVTIVALCFCIASVNGANLYVTLKTKSDVVQRLESLELDVAALKRKNVGVDKALTEGVDKILDKLK